VTTRRLPSWGGVQPDGELRHNPHGATAVADPVRRLPGVDWTSRAAAELERLGLHPYMVIEDWELPQMRDWFGIAQDAPVPWPLVARLREPVGVNLLDLRSRPAEHTVPAALSPGGTSRCSAPQPLTIQRSEH
jgi:hypothetical protein